MQLMSKNVLHIFSSKIFMVACLIFKSLSHFYLFCEYPEGASSSINLHLGWRNINKIRIKRKSPIHLDTLVYAGFIDIFET